MSRAIALRNSGCEVKIISPIGLTPPKRLFFPKPAIRSALNYWKKQSAIPYEENLNGFQVFHPKWYWAPRKYFWRYEIDLLHKFAGKKIHRIIRDFNPDLIISSWIHPFGTYAYIVKKKRDILFFTIPEGDDILIYPDNFPGWKWIEKKINSFCDLVVCVSQRMKEEIEYKRNLIKLKVINNGYNQDLFFSSHSQKLRQKKEINIISVGYFGKIKGHDILLKAMKLLDEKYRLLLIGDGMLHREYEKFVENNALAKRVNIIGQIEQDQLPKYMKEADIFCMPSRSESFGIAMAEAMACGLPVVATDVGGNSEKVKIGFNGYLCQPESPRDLSEKISKAANTKWNHEEIANWIKKKYSWDKWAKEILTSYIEIKLKRDP